MSESVWSLEPYQKQPLHPEQDIELAYTIPYSWGNLYMSDAAHEAYGLIPLTPDAQDSELVKSRAKPARPEFDITLVGPDEFFTEDKDDTYSEEMLRLKRQFNANGIELTIGFSEDIAEIKDGLRASMREDVAEMFGIDPERVEEHLDQVVDEDDIPMTQSLEQEVPQMLAHDLCMVIKVAGAAAIYEWSNADLNKQFYRRIKARGGLALAGVGVFTAVPTLFGEFHLPNLLAAGALTVFGANLLRSELRHYLAADGHRKQDAQLHAAKGAVAIASDIHNSFCRYHFDKQMEQRFET